MAETLAPPRIALGLDVDNTTANLRRGVAVAYPHALDVIENLQSNPNVAFHGFYTSRPKLLNGRLTRWQVTSMGISADTTITHGHDRFTSKLRHMLVDSLTGDDPELWPSRICLVDNSERQLINSYRKLRRKDKDSKVQAALDRFSPIIFKPRTKLTGRITEDKLNLQYMNDWKDLPDLLGLTPQVGLAA